MKSVFDLIRANEAEEIRKLTPTDLMEKNENGNTSLMVAIKKKKKLVINSILEKANKELLEEPNEKGETPLIYALYSKNEALALRLIELGVDINKGTKQNFTPLIVATAKTCIKVAKKLIELGANIHTVSSFGMTALSNAALYGEEELVKLLLDKGVDKSVEDSFFCMNAASWAKWHGHNELSDYILEYGEVEGVLNA